MQHGLMHNNVFMCCSLTSVFTISRRYTGVHRAGLAPGTHYPRASANWEEIQEDAVQSQVCSLNSISPLSQEWELFLMQFISLLSGKYCQNCLAFVVYFFSSVNSELKIYLWLSNSVGWDQVNFLMVLSHPSRFSHPHVKCILVLPAFLHAVGVLGIPFLGLSWPPFQDHSVLVSFTQTNVSSAHGHSTPGS